MFTQRLKQQQNQRQTGYWKRKCNLVSSVETSKGRRMRNREKSTTEYVTLTHEDIFLFAEKEEEQVREEKGTQEENMTTSSSWNFLLLI